LHKTLEDASQVIAAFISMGRSGETPIDSLLTAADHALDDLVKWRAGLKDVVLEFGNH